MDTQLAGHKIDLLYTYLYLEFSNQQPLVKNTGMSAALYLWGMPPEFLYRGYTGNIGLRTALEEKRGATFLLQTTRRKHVVGNSCMQMFRRHFVAIVSKKCAVLFEPPTFSVAGAITSLNNAVAVPSIITVWLLVFYSKQMPLDMPRPGYKITMMPTKELLQTKKVSISGRLFSFWLPLSILLSSGSHWLTSKKHEFMQVVQVCCCWRRHPAPGNLQCIVYMLWVSARSKGAIATGLLPQDVIHKSFQTYTGMLGDAILYIIPLICPCLSHTLNFPRVICIQLTPSDTGLIPTHTNIWQLCKLFAQRAEVFAPLCHFDSGACTGPKPVPCPLSVLGKQRLWRYISWMRLWRLKIYIYIINGFIDGLL